MRREVILENKSYDLVLPLELIPTTSFFQNLRNKLQPTKWNKLKSYFFEEHGHKCQVCGKIGRTHPVELHEVWDFNTDNNKYIQSLIEFQSLCPTCHKTKHIGCTSLYAKNIMVFYKHFDKINNINNMEISNKIINGFFQEHEERSQHNWEVDIQLLSDLKVFKL